MAEEPAVDFGTFLRQAREKRGISLQQVSATTKISVRVFDALERNDPRKLPGGIFSRAFVRAYAREVGLDPEVVIEQFTAAFPEQARSETTPATAVSDDQETFESRRRAAITVAQLLGISLVIVVIVLIYYGTRRSQPPVVRVVSEATQEPRATPPPMTSALAQPGSPSGMPAADTQGTPGAQPVQPTVAASPAPATPTPAAPAAPLTIDISTTAVCWLSLTVDGRPVVVRTLEAGERVSYPVRTSVTIVAGNAGALSLTLNGKAARPIGASGAVVTTTITPDTFKNFLQQP
jgi:cytoskeletal protein RodZ